jgi:hypothetical protein
VLDPACGSGNFLYVSLQLLLHLEKEVVTYAMQLGFKLVPQVSVQQLKAIEINPYAFERILRHPPRSHSEVQTVPCVILGEPAVPRPA